ncbi:hypothetical protein [Candidatus Enterovibrio altilux]|nr:hypothetical protein [Candidatus Enterovibrio luxaltus]
MPAGAMLFKARLTISKISGDGAYYTRQCDETVRIKRVAPFIPPRKGVILGG